MTDLFELAAVPQPDPKKPPVCLPDVQIQETVKQIEICQPALEITDPMRDGEHSHLVASFACYCGGQSEVLEPAPETIPCWVCKKSMHRFVPVFAPPLTNAMPWKEMT